MPRARETIFALSSGRPPAAVAVIRTSGPDAHRAAGLLSRLPPPREAALRTLRDPRDGKLLDQALVVRFDRPDSATGEDVVEYQCHGGRAVVDAVLAALASIDGMRLAAPGEFTRRALTNGRIDLTEAEGLADLLEAETEAQRRSALASASGGLRRQIESWQARLVELSARAEAAIDYVGEEDVDSGDEALAIDTRALGQELRQWLERPRVEPLRDGLRVVVAGPTNAGKSSLVNAISQSEKAIVTAVPGTTRDSIEVPLAIGGVAFVLVDTAGLRDSYDPVERIGVKRSRSELAAADIVLWLGESDEAPRHSQLLCIHSLADRPERSHVASGSIAVSSLSLQGIETLLEALLAIATNLLPGEGALALNRRQAQTLSAVEAELGAAAGVTDPLLLAEHLREARSRFDRLTGHASTEAMLDALFARFCLGK